MSSFAFKCLGLSKTLTFYLPTVSNRIMTFEMVTKAGHMMLLGWKAIQLYSRRQQILKGETLSLGAGNSSSPPSVWNTVGGNYNSQAHNLNDTTVSPLTTYVSIRTVLGWDVLSIHMHTKSNVQKILKGSPKVYAWEAMLEGSWKVVPGLS